MFNFKRLSSFRFRISDLLLLCLKCWNQVLTSFQRVKDDDGYGFTIKGL